MIRASAGAGKSTLVRQAIVENNAEPRGTDLYHECAPGDTDASRLAARLAAATGLPAPAGEDEAVFAIVDHVAGRSPESICLILDDAHLVAGASGGGRFLRRLVDERPHNLSFVFVTRDDLPIPLARRVARDEVVMLDGDNELFLDHDERIELLGGLHTRGNDYDGWPAMVALAHRAGSDVAADFLFEEVVQSLPADVQSLLATLASSGAASIDALRALTGADDDALAALRSLPLISGARPGILQAHDLWRSATRAIVAPPTAMIVDLLLADGEHDSALRTAVESKDADLVDRVLVAAVSASVPVVPRDTAERWLDSLSGTARQRAPARLLAVAAGLPVGDLPGLAMELAADFAAAGDETARLAALAVAANRAYDATDFECILGIRAELDHLTPPLPPFLDTIRHAVDAVSADLGGDAALALDHLDRIDYDTAPANLREQLVRLRATNLVALGRPAEGVAVAEAELGRSRSAHVAMTADVLRWFAGDPRPLRAQENNEGVEQLHGPEALIREAFGIHFSAAYGRPAIVDGELPSRPLVPLAAGVPRLLTMAAVADALTTLMRDGDETAAGERLSKALAELDPAEPTVATELMRFLPVAAILSPDAVDLDRAAASGPAHRRTAAMTRLLLDARDGRLDPTCAAPDVGGLITSLPLPWSVELVARAAAAGAAWAPTVGAELADEVGEAVRESLTHYAASDDEVLADGAKRLRREAPLDPGFELRVELLGPLVVRRNGAVVDDPLTRRIRVRQLLAMLAVGDGQTRAQLIDALWPDTDPEKGMRSLRTNLSHVRRLLEPDLPARSPSYFVRMIGDTLSFAGARMTTDIEEFESEMAAAAAADDAGRASDALAHYTRASALWRGTPLDDIADIERYAGVASGFQRRAARAAVRSAEILLARGAVQEALVHADRARTIEPFDEASHRATVAAHLAAADSVAAEAALESVADLEADGLLHLGQESRMVMRRARDWLDSRERV